MTETNPHPNQCHVFPGGSVTEIGSCFRSIDTIVTNGCLSLQLEQLSSISKNNDNSKKNNLEDIYDFSECTTRSLCIPSQVCRIYDKQPVNQEVPRKPLFCMERIEVDSQNYQWIFVDYRRNNNSNNNESSRTQDTTDIFNIGQHSDNEKKNWPSCQPVSQNSQFFQCEETNGNCQFNALITLTNSSSSIMNNSRGGTGIIDRNNINNNPVVPTKNDSTERKGGNDLFNLFIYLLVPFLIIAIIIPCIIMKMKRCSCWSRSKPIVTKSAPVEIVYVTDRRALNPDFELQQQEKNPALFNDEMEEEEESRIDDDHEEMVSVVKRETANKKSSPNDVNYEHAIDMSAMTYSSSFATALMASSSSSSPHTGQLSNDGDGYITDGINTWIMISNDSLAGTSGDVEKNSGQHQNTNKKSVTSSPSVERRSQTHLAPDTVENKRHSRQNTTTTSSHRTRDSARSAYSFSPFRISLRLDDQGMPIFQEDLVGEESFIRQIFGNQKAPVTESTAIVYSERPPDYETALTDGVNRPGDRN